MSNELDETFNGPATETPIIVVAPPTEEQVEQEIDLVSEQVAVLSIENEERHDQILEELSACRERLENSSTSMTPESPILNQILAEVLEIKSRVVTLERQSQTTESNPNSSNLPQSESTPTRTDQSALETVESTDELNKPEPHVKRNRAI